MSESTNSTPLKNVATKTQQPRQQPLQTADAHTRKFPEGKVYAFVVIGFFVCENLTNVWLPALGLRTLAHQYENVADFIAPYLLMPICLILVINLFKRSLIAGVIGIAGSLMLDWYFFIRYDLLLSRLSLVVFGIAVLWSYYRLQKQGQDQKRLRLLLPVRKGERWLRRAIYTGIYIISFLVAVYVAPLLRKTASAVWERRVARNCCIAYPCRSGSSTCFSTF